MREVFTEFADFCNPADLSELLAEVFAGDVLKLCIYSGLLFSILEARMT